MFSSQKLAQILAKKKMTQAKLAKLSGIHASRICEYMNDKFCPTTHNLGRIAEALDVEIKELCVYATHKDAYTSMRSRLEKELADPASDTERIKVIAEAIGKLYKPVEVAPDEGSPENNVTGEVKLTFSK